MTTGIAILIGVGIGLLIIGIVVFFAIWSSRYTRTHLGLTRILTNGDKYVVQQYGYLGKFVNKWVSGRRSAYLNFFSGKYPDWYYINDDAYVAMTGFGTQENVMYQFDTLEDAQKVTRRARDNFLEQKKEHEYKLREWKEVNR